MSLQADMHVSYIVCILNSFNCVHDNPAVPIVWCFREVDRRLEVLLSVTVVVHTDFVTSCGVSWAFLSPSSYFNCFRRPEDE